LHTDETRLFKVSGLSPRWRWEWWCKHQTTGDKLPFNEGVDIDFMVMCCKKLCHLFWFLSF